MKKIAFNTPGATLERSPDGKLVRKSFRGTAELPFSEDNLQQAKAAALPGTMRILSVEEHNEKHNIPNEEVLQRICLADRATGKPFEVYIENGQLMMEGL